MVVLNGDYPQEPHSVVDGEINDLLELEDGLTEWELDFIESVAQKRDSMILLTEKQEEKLHQIWTVRYK